MKKFILILFFPFLCHSQIISLKLKNEYFVNVINDNASLSQLLQSNGCVIQCKFPSVEKLNTTKKLLITCDKNIQDVYKALSNQNISQQIQIMEVPTATGCSNPVNYNDAWMLNAGSLNYHLDMIDAKCAWGITKGNPNVIISVVDTRFEPTHEDMIGRFAGVDGAGLADDHGIWVSGLVAANTNNNIGIAAVGYNCKVFGRQANGVNIGDGVLRAARAGNKVINVSWTSTGLDEQEMRDSVINRGSVVVFAAGNDSSVVNYNLYQVGNIPGVIVVSGVTNKNEHTHTREARNSFVDLCAPSINISSTYANNSYGQLWNGTSFAAPIVAGVIGLMISVNPCLTPAQIEQLIKANTDPISDGNLYPGLLGTGRVNAYKAVSAAKAAASVQFFQNQTIPTSTVNQAYVAIGSNVTTTLPNGAVSIANNSNWTINAREVTIKNDFTVPLGATLTINPTPNQTVSCP